MTRMALAVLLFLGLATSAAAQNAPTSNPTGGGAAEAPAATQKPSPEDMRIFAAFLSSSAFLSGLTRLINASEPPSLQAACPTLKLLDATRYKLLKTVTFREVNGSEQVSGGSWISLAIADRCGQKVTRRFLFFYQPETERLQPLRLLPGEFRGDLKTEADARNLAAKVITAATHCDDPKRIFVLDTKVDGAPSPDRWRENWTAEACGEPVTLQAAYSRSGDGHIKVDMAILEAGGK